MSYEINVSLKGSHYFATAPRSLTTASDTTAMALDFKKRFPVSEGFQITVRYSPQQSWSIQLDGDESDTDIENAIENLSDNE